MLRPKLGYTWKSLHYLAIVEDFILYFAWSLKLSLGLHLQAQDNLFYTVLAGLEIFRRFVWNIYEVEYDHVKSKMYRKCMTRVKFNRFTLKSR